MMQVVMIMNDGSEHPAELDLYYIDDDDGHDTEIKSCREKQRNTKPQKTGKEKRNHERISSVREQNHLVTPHTKKNSKTLRKYKHFRNEIKIFLKKCTTLF